jgi:hypothetical protein
MSDIAPTPPSAAPPVAPPLKRIEHVFSAYGHVVDEGVDWRAVCTQKYWGKNIERFRDGDTVEVHTHDHRIIFVMRILSVNPAANYLDCVFLPVFPPDLALPEMPRQRAPRFEARMAPGGAGYIVLDLRTGERCGQNPTARGVAVEQAAQLEAALNATEEAMRRGEAGDVGKFPTLADEFERVRSAKAAKPKASRGRGRPRKPAVRIDEPPAPMAAAPAQGENP